MKNLVYCYLVVVVLSSCDPCSDCGEPLLFEPTVEMVFINQDSINRIDDSLAVFSFNDSVLNVNIDSINVLRDSLQIVLDSIDNGGDLAGEKMNLEAWISLRQQDSSFYAILNQNADSLSGILTSVKTSINTGLLRIDDLMVVETGEIVETSDSLTSWSFPLLFDGNATSYDFSIASEPYTIAVGYTAFTEVDQQRNVLIRAKDITIIESSDNFLSLDSCTINCEDGNATFTFYF